MQEQTTRTMDTINQFDGDDSVPTLEGVRDKIERRYADALGAQELAKSSMNDRMAEIEAAGTDVAATERLAEIRASMGDEQGQLESGATANTTQDVQDAKDARDAEEHAANDKVSRGSTRLPRATDTDEKADSTADAEVEDTD